MKSWVGASSLTNWGHTGIALQQPAAAAMRELVLGTAAKGAGFRVGVTDVVVHGRVHARPHIGTVARLHADGGAGVRPRAPHEPERLRVHVRTGRVPHGGACDVCVRAQAHV